MSNLFDQIAKTTTTKKTKKNDKPLIKINGDEFDSNLKAFVELKQRFDEVKTQLTLVQDYIKDCSIDEWCEFYNKNGSYPGSTLVTSENASFMFAPSDKYLSVNDERAEELKEKYGDDIITEDITFSFNPTLLGKYAEVLSDLIQNSKDISDNDKNNLIVANKNISVKKGTIEKALTVGKGKIKEFIKDINPIFSLRTPKIV